MTTYTERIDDTIVPWWLVLLEGIAATLIGILLLTAPGITLFALIQITGFFWLVGGIFRVVSIFVESSRILLLDNRACVTCSPGRDKRDKCPCDS